MCDQMLQIGLVSPHLVLKYLIRLVVSSLAQLSAELVFSLKYFTFSELTQGKDLLRASWIAGVHGQDHPERPRGGVGSGGEHGLRAPPYAVLGTVGVPFHASPEQVSFRLISIGSKPIICLSYSVELQS